VDTVLLQVASQLTANDVFPKDQRIVAHFHYQADIKQHYDTALGTYVHKPQEKDCMAVDKMDIDQNDICVACGIYDDSLAASWPSTTTKNLQVTRMRHDAQKYHVSRATR
jgi:hypothetical protein